MARERIEREGPDRLSRLAGRYLGSRDGTHGTNVQLLGDVNTAISDVLQLFGLGSLDADLVAGDQTAGAGPGRDLLMEFRAVVRHAALGAAKDDPVKKLKGSILGLCDQLRDQVGAADLPQEQEMLRGRWGERFR